MSLRGFVHGFTSSVNPDTTGNAYLSSGNTPGYGGVRTPTFTRAEGLDFQVQSASTRGLKRAEALNIQGKFREVYFQGQLSGIERLAGKGGDILMFDAAFWLVIDVLEDWDRDGWVRVLVCQQVNPPEGFDDNGEPV